MGRAQPVSRLAATLLTLLAVLLVVVPLWLSVQGAGAPGTTGDDERTVRSAGGRVFIGGGIRAGK